MIKEENSNRNILLISSILVLLFLLSRLINILVLPIFTDEAIYMRWAQIALHDASWRFISLTDGKQPFFIWLTMILMRYINNPLLCGRLVSVVGGLIGLAGSFFLGRELFKNKTIGYLSAVLYLISPFFLWYNKMALMDSLLSGLYIWSLYLEVLLVRNVRLDTALLLGMVTGAGLLTKTSAFFTIYLFPLFLVLFDWKKGFRELLKLIGLVLLSVFIALGLYSILRLSPWFYIIAQKDNTFLYSVSQIIKDPLQFFWGNLRGLMGWWYGYLTLPFIILLLVGLSLKDKKTCIVRWFLFALFIMPLGALAMFGKVLYPRFILFMTVSLFPLMAYGLYRLTDMVKNTKVKLLLILVIFIYPLYFDSQIIFNTIGAPLPSSDRKQYLDDWPSGYGVPEVINFLKLEKEKQPIYVATEGTFGLFPYALELEFFSDPKIIINGYWPLPTQQTLINRAEGKPVYLLLKESQELPPDYRNFQQIGQYQRGQGDTYLKFYRLL